MSLFETGSNKLLEDHLVYRLSCVNELSQFVISTLVLERAKFHYVSR
jgi:hypothetical protein